MKTKILTIVSILLLSANHNLWAAYENILLTGNGKIDISSFYSDNVYRNWTIDTGQNDKPVRLDYDINLEYGSDYITIISINEQGYASDFEMNLTGTQKGSIITSLPTGKVLITLSTDANNANNEHLEDSSISYSAVEGFTSTNNLFVNESAHIAGKLGVGTAPTTGKFFVYNEANKTGTPYGIYSYSSNTVSNGSAMGIYSYGSASTNGYAYGLQANAYGYANSTVYGVYSSVNGSPIAKKWSGYFTGGDVAVMNGNIGIGTTTSTSPLSIGDNHGVKLSVGNSSWVNPVIVATGWSQELGDYTDIKVPGGAANTANIRLLRNGNVGIGTETPAYKLDVNGITQTNRLLINRPNEISNWNNLWQSGFYDSDNKENAPETGQWFWGIHMGHQSNSPDYRYGGQIAIRNSNTSPTMYFRSTNANGEGVWTKVLHSTGDQTINGKLGIGTTNPQAALDINGDARISKIQTQKIDLAFNDYFVHNGQNLGHYSVGWYSDSWHTGSRTLWQSAYAGMKFFTAGQLRLAIKANGNIGIGKEDPYYKLDVNGIIRAHEVKINLNSGADFVFAEDYKLMNLSELDHFVSTNKHLPDVAPAAEMVSNGVDMGEFQVKLLQKIEELTLYIIEQDKRIKELETKAHR